MWRMGGGYRGRKGGSTLDRGGGQRGSRRDPNAIDIDRSRGEDRTCYVCGKWGHMAKNCWERHKERVVETLQESAKESREQEEDIEEKEEEVHLIEEEVKRVQGETQMQ